MTDKVQVRCKRLDPKGQIDFAMEINKYIEQGYKILITDTRHEAPKFVARPVVIMVKDSQENPSEVKEDGIPKENKTERSVEDIMEDKKASKEEVIELAAKLGIELPESAKAPLAIKKVIKETLAERNKPEETKQDSEGEKSAE